MISIRGSLARVADITLTPQEIEARRLAAEREAWETAGLVVIGIHDPKIEPAVRAIAEAVAIKKFGKRAGAGR